MDVSPRASVASVDSPTTTTLDDKEAAIVRKSLGIVKQAGIILAKCKKCANFFKNNFFQLGNGSFPKLWSMIGNRQQFIGLQPR
jgi:hypothetical protein